MSEITCRAVIEVLGKPEQHVLDSLNSYVEKLTGDERYTIKAKEIAEIKKHNDEDLFVSFAEIEFMVNKVEDLVSFCFEYMPSIIEVISPGELKFTNYDVSQFLNDMQARLHHVDMVAKQIKMKNDHLNKNMRSLLLNYIMLLLRKNDLTLNQLSQFTGVKEELLGDYLDHLIDNEKVDLNGETYSLKDNGQ
jgi:hypothetical protein